ncbi:MAG: hypothetical protein ACYTFF_12380 [Planctomycetota bacterium]|jgi:hypothetical protein
MPHDAVRDDRATPLAAVLGLTFLCSLGTGVFWHGVPFIAKHTYDFSQTRNLLLAAAMGGVYTLGAFTAGRVTRLVERWLTPRGVLAACVTTLAVVCLGPITVDREWALWLAAIVGTWVTAIIWPLIESYLTAGRHGAQMRSAIGWFNLTWAPAVAIPLLAMAPILERHGEWAIGAFVPINVIGLVMLAWFGRQPGHHDPETAAFHVGGEYRLLLRSARVLLPLSYVLSSAMNPILPYRFEALDVAVWWETPATATWTLVRVLAFVTMWRLGFWHGRWGTLLLGGAAMTAGFALVVVGPDLPFMLAGFATLGAGVGVIYYAALYYAMAVGRAQVEAGGTHEGLIGAGYATGPMIGLLGSAVAGGLGIVVAVWTLVGLAGAPAVRPYAQARAQRRRQAPGP